MNQRPMWKMVQHIKDEELERAFEDRAKQGDLVAAQCVALVMENRRAVREGQEAR